MLKLKHSLAALAAVSALLAGGAVYAADHAAPKKGKSVGEEGYVWNAGGGEEDEALGLKPDLKNGREVYEVCSACHQPEGWGLPDGTFPQLAGQHYKVIIKQLADIRALNRENPTMYPFALPSQIGGPQAVADVAGYIQTLKMSPENGKGDGKDPALGKKLYADNCTRCHGAAGEGDNEKFYPRIEAQHYAYLLRQFNEIKAGKRRNANPDMVKQIHDFTDQETRAVLDYVSRLVPPKEKVAPKGWKNPDFQ
ncbi:c-type cytochrome [Magnetospirillum sp. 15-1]|uniref:c-type cytochrome n=1 Tax=Magnetospirillum sp. 15-1 TaxID=1979370 RepID=UPI000BBCD60B|nr:c-type cytochrome [Magnetospirillum sp. 15-1]